MAAPPAAHADPASTIRPSANALSGRKSHFCDSPLLYSIVATRPPDALAGGEGMPWYPAGAHASTSQRRVFPSRNGFSVRSNTVAGNALVLAVGIDRDLKPHGVAERALQLVPRRLERERLDGNVLRRPGLPRVAAAEVRRRQVVRELDVLPAHRRVDELGRDAEHALALRDGKVGRHRRRHDRRLPRPRLRIVDVRRVRPVPPSRRPRRRDPRVRTVVVKARRRRLGEERKPLTPTNDTCELAPGPELRGVHRAAVRGDVGNEPALVVSGPDGLQLDEERL